MILKRLKDIMKKFEIKDIRRGRPMFYLVIASFILEILIKL